MCQRIPAILVVAQLVLAASAGAQALMTARACEGSRGGDRFDPISDPVSMSYEQIIKLDVVDRIDVFRAVDSQTRSQLWRDQIGRYLEQHPDLAEEKRAVAARALELIDSGMFEVLSDDQDPNHRSVERHLKAFEIYASSFLTGQEMGAMLGVLGDRPPAEGSAKACSLKTQCECYVQGSNFCGFSEICAFVEGGCKGSRFGCGLFWGYSCNGVCVNPEGCD